MSKSIYISNVFTLRFFLEVQSTGDNKALAGYTGWLPVIGKYPKPKK